jgi:hypothetical protein
MASRKTGSCAACGYFPVAFDAVCCPRCGAQNKTPTLVDRFVGRGMLIGLGAGTLVGAALMWVTKRPEDAADRLAALITGAMVGAIPGLIVGLLFGLVAAVFADLFCKLFGRPLKAPAGEFIVPDDVEVRYCGYCQQRQAATEEGCVYCGRPTVIWHPSRESEGLALRRWAEVNRET